MKVWLCWHGSYEDARVVAVLSKETDALRAEDLFGWSIEEVEVDKVLVPPWPEGKRPFYLRASRSPTTGDGRPSETLTHCDALPATGLIPIETTWDDSMLRRGPLGLTTYGSTWATDQGEALLEANRKLQEILARKPTP